MPAWIIDRLNRDRQERNDRKSWDRGIHAPTPQPVSPPKQKEDDKRGTSNIGFLL